MKAARAPRATQAAHQCSSVCRMTGEMAASSHAALAFTILFSSARFQRPLAPVTPAQRLIWRASSAVRRPR